MAIPQPMPTYSSRWAFKLSFWKTSILKKEKWEWIILKWSLHGYPIWTILRRDLPQYFPTFSTKILSRFLRCKESTAWNLMMMMMMIKAVFLIRYLDLCSLLVEWGLFIEQIRCLSLLTWETILLKSLIIINSLTKLLIKSLTIQMARCRLFTALVWIIIVLWTKSYAKFLQI